MFRQCSRISRIGGTGSHSTDSSCLALEIGCNWNEALFIHIMYTEWCTNKHLVSKWRAFYVIFQIKFSHNFINFCILIQSSSLWMDSLCMKMVFHNMWQVFRTLNQLNFYHLHFFLSSHTHWLYKLKIIHVFIWFAQFFPNTN